MTISYLSKKAFKSEEFLAASIARLIPTEVALLLSLLSSTAIISSVLLALHFNDPITTTMTRMEIATTLFIARGKYGGLSGVPWKSITGAQLQWKQQWQQRVNVTYKVLKRVVNSNRWLKTNNALITHLNVTYTIQVMLVSHPGTYINPSSSGKYFRVKSFILLRSANSFKKGFAITKTPQSEALVPFIYFVSCCLFKGGK